MHLYVYMYTYVYVSVLHHLSPQFLVHSFSFVSKSPVAMAPSNRVFNGSNRYGNRFSKPESTRHKCTRYERPTNTNTRIALCKLICLK